MSEDERELAVTGDAGDLFEIRKLPNGHVYFRMYDLEADLPPETAAWLSWDLCLAAGRPFPPPLRLVKKEKPDGRTDQAAVGVPGEGDGGGSAGAG